MCANFHVRIPIIPLPSSTQSCINFQLLGLLGFLLALWRLNNTDVVIETRCRFWHKCNRMSRPPRGRRDGGWNHTHMPLNQVSTYTLHTYIHIYTENMLTYPLSFLFFVCTDFYPPLLPPTGGFSSIITVRRGGWNGELNAAVSGVSLTR
jgi:hypothetical protein